MAILVILAILIVLVLAATLILIPKKVVIDSGYKQRESTAPRKIGFGVVGGLFAILLLATAFESFYSQDTGEASVLVDISGNIAGQETTPGFHGKAPWQSVKTFNVRNQNVSYIGDGQTDFNGGSAKGPSITATDSDGVASEVNINVRYSINPSKVTDIYKQYKDESSFLSNYVTLTIQGVVRKVPNSFTTLDLITKQGEVQTKIQDALVQQFQGSGVTVDNVSLQKIDPPQAIKASYATAQQAQINVTAEKAKLEATQVSAQQQVVQAKAQAQANAELNKGLTPQVLQSRYIDALKSIGDKGNLVVVPQGSNPLVNISKK